MENQSTSAAQTFEIDVDAVYRAAKARWLRNEAPRRSLADWLSLISPYFVLLVFAASYALSAPHTAALIDMLTPGVGYLAPIMVEIGLISCAIAIQQGKLTTAPAPRIVYVLRNLMFVTALATNTVGALHNVLISVGIAEYSFRAFFAALGDLPINTLTSTAMAFIMGAIVPIVCEFAGTRIAQLVFDSQRPNNSRAESAWRDIETEILYRALYSIMQSRGYAPKAAAAAAVASVKGYLGSFARLPRLAANNEQTSNEQTSNEQTAPSKLERARAWLDQNPDKSALSLNALIAQTKRTAEVADIGRSTWYEAQKGGKNAIL